MKDVEQQSSTQVAMPVSELHGRTVWTESGERIGVVRGVNQDDDGRIVSLDVRERWMLGAHHEVPAAGMRLDNGDIVVPPSAKAAVDADRDGDRKHDHDHDGDGHRDRAHVDSDDAVVGSGRVVNHRDVQARSASGSVASAPVLLAGREGAKGRFGGLDVIGSLFGALVTIACLVIIGGVLAAVFGTQAASFDTSLSSLEDVLTESTIIAAVTLFLSCFIGGWAAGRSARFDGVGNGLMTVVWVLGIALVLGGLGAWVGDEYDVFANVDLPAVSTEDFQLWGSVALAAALVLMLVGAALGGALGESWHRRADRAMLDVVDVDQRARD